MGSTTAGEQDGVAASSCFKGVAHKGAALLPECNLPCGVLVERGEGRQGQHGELPQQLL